MGDTRAGGDDDRYVKKHHSYDAESLRRLAYLCERFDRSESEVLRLGLLAIEGNLRLFRHAAAQPLQALATAERLYRMRLRGPADAELHDVLKLAREEITELLAPPPEPPPPAKA